MKTLYFFLTLCFACVIEIACGQSTLTVGLGPTAQTVQLGLYGDKHLTQITFVCMTSASNYKWAIDAPWQTTTGKKNTFTTTTNTITIVPIPGYAGCAGGTVGVSSGGAAPLLVAAGRDGKSARQVSTQSSFSYIAGLNQPGPYININYIGITGQGGNVSILGTELVNFYNSGVSYSSWSLTNATNSTNLWYAQSAGNQSGQIYVLPAPSSSITYSATINTTVSVSGSSGCTGTITRNLVVHPALDPSPATINSCYNFNLDKVDCYTGKTSGTSRVASLVSPNPATTEFNVNLEDGATTSISLYNSQGVLVGSKENVNNNFSWDTSSLPKGKYIVKIKHGDKSTSERLVIE